ncbi:hypothetical protein BDZ91DRAFT_796102 [Kalaharituber pfeilii]|nr:hypothetical protein BDZ91DRAFT_796102 [Kalaharituber pfeilii]
MPPIIPAPPHQFSRQHENCHSQRRPNHQHHNPARAAPPLKFLQSPPTIPSSISSLSSFDGPLLHKFWKVFKASSTVLPAGHRLENLFWRIWGSERLRDTLPGSRVGALFMMIQKGEGLALNKEIGAQQVETVNDGGATAVRGALKETVSTPNEVTKTTVMTTIPIDAVTAPAEASAPPAVIPEFVYSYSSSQQGGPPTPPPSPTIGVARILHYGPNGVGHGGVGGAANGAANSGVAPDFTTALNEAFRQLKQRASPPSPMASPLLGTAGEQGNGRERGEQEGREGGYFAVTAAERRNPGMVQPWQHLQFQQQIQRRIEEQHPSVAPAAKTTTNMGPPSLPPAPVESQYAQASTSALPAEEGKANADFQRVASTTSIAESTTSETTGRAGVAKKNAKSGTGTLGKKAKGKFVAHAHGHVHVGKKAGPVRPGLIRQKSSTTSSAAAAEREERDRGRQREKEEVEEEVEDFDDDEGEELVLGGTKGSQKEVPTPPPPPPPPPPPTVQQNFPPQRITIQELPKPRQKAPLDRGVAPAPSQIGPAPAPAPAPAPEEDDNEYVDEDEDYGPNPHHVAPPMRRVVSAGGAIGGGKKGKRAASTVRLSKKHRNVSANAGRATAGLGIAAVLGGPGTAAAAAVAKKEKEKERELAAAAPLVEPDFRRKFQERHMMTRATSADSMSSSAMKPSGAGRGEFGHYHESGNGDADGSTLGPHATQPKRREKLVFLTSETEAKAVKSHATVSVATDTSGVAVARMVQGKLLVVEGAGICGLDMEVMGRGAGGGIGLGSGYESLRMQRSATTQGTTTGGSLGGVMGAGFSKAAAGTVGAGSGPAIMTSRMSTLSLMIADMRRKDASATNGDGAAKGSVPFGGRI